MKQINILISDRVKTQFMQNMDVFEKCKVVICPLVKADVGDDFGDSNVEAIKKQHEGSPYSLVAIYDRYKVYYRDPEVKSISDGTCWTTLDDHLASWSKP